MLPTEIIFTITDDVFQAADNGRPAETYGAEFGGQIKLRWPTNHEFRLLISSRASAKVLEAKGDPLTVDRWGAIFAQAMAFFDVLALPGGRPAWLTEGQRYSPKGDAAVFHAYDRALGELGAQKKSAEPTGETSSPTT